MVLSRFHQPLIVSQILVGLLVSPWILGYPFIKKTDGRSAGITDFIFHKEGLQVVHMLAEFSSMFFIFKVGVQMDPKILKRARWRTYVIGFSCILCSTISGDVLSRLLKNNDIPGLKPLKGRSGFLSSQLVTDLFSMTSFPVIAYTLTDLNILNSDLGSLAIDVAMVAEIFSTGKAIWTLIRPLFFTEGHHLFSDGSVVMLFLLGTLICIFFIVRPEALWIIKNTPEGRPVSDVYITLIMISVLLCGLAGGYCGLNATLFPFFLGLAIPDGPPLGSALVHKLRIVTVFFMPLHMGIVGYMTTIHKVHFWLLWRVLLVILGCILGKIIGLFFPAVLLGVSVRDSLLVGLIMNFKGIVEVTQLNTRIELKAKNSTFAAANTIMVLTLVVLVAVITPAVKYLYDPSSKYLTNKGRSILQSNENNSDFRVLVCVHTQDDVPSIIRLLEASNPTKFHPLTVYVLHLVELVGRASPLLIAYPLHKRASTSNPTKSERIINVFQQFQNQYQNLVSVHPFSTISPYASMHTDICTMSVEKRTALIIFPFSRQDAVIAISNISNHSIKHLLQNMLRSNPCSLGILIDGNNQPTRFLTGTPYRVIVLFFGGVDDREALAFAMNMIRHPSVFVTLIRFYGLPSYGDINESVSIDVDRHKLLDDELVDHFRVNAMQDETLMYKQVEVNDVAETIWAVRSLHDDFDLMVVGRQQIIDPIMNSGLDTDWDEYQELGDIGAMVTSPEYDAEGSILIVHAVHA
ncbi:hypothetical protein MKX03_024335 [Papaver bracteatum]|nr:hypothetical protein MKX03_024335 [Papaver bracteatum]